MAPAGSLKPTAILRGYLVVLFTLKANRNLDVKCIGYKLGIHDVYKQDNYNTYVFISVGLEREEGVGWGGGGTMNAGPRSVPGKSRRKNSIQGHRRLRK